MRPLSHFALKLSPFPHAGGSLAIAETSYRSRLLFMSLRETINHPDPIAWGHHVFLRLSGPLSSGTYNVTVAAAAFGQEVTLQLLVDEDKTLNENIHVNQVRVTHLTPTCATLSPFAKGWALLQQLIVDQIRALALLSCWHRRNLCPGLRLRVLRP